MEVDPVRVEVVAGLDDVVAGKDFGGGAGRRILVGFVLLARGTILGVLVEGREALENRKDERV